MGQTVSSIAAVLHATEFAIELPQEISVKKFIVL